MALIRKFAEGKEQFEGELCDLAEELKKFGSFAEFEMQDLRNYVATLQPVFVEV